MLINRENARLISILLFYCAVHNFQLNSRITMNNMYRVYLGIDVGIGPKPVTFVALDPGQQALAIGEGDVADALAYAAGQNTGALVAVNAAARPNQGRMTRPDVRRGLTPPPPKGKFTALRQVEYELITAGIEIPETPTSPEKSLPWVRRGFSLVEKLAAIGYQPFPCDGSEPTGSRLWLETNANAGFWSLLGVVPLETGTLEGRIQRQLALRDEQLEVPDAMDFFEELTRFKILKSNLPTKYIFSQPEINAWLAAHTAWLLANQPERIQKYGEPEEGFIFLPLKSEGD
jgi:hypothetical protein